MFSGVGSGHKVAAAGAVGEPPKADARELQLLAFILRLLRRKRLLIDEVRRVCTDAEAALRASVNIHIYIYIYVYTYKYTRYSDYY